MAVCAQTAAIPAGPVFVTGANGFVGASICRRLAALGVEVTGLVRRESDLSLLAGAGVRLVRGDLRRPAALAIDPATRTVIHSAAVVSDCAGDDACREGILGATQNLVELVRARCPGLVRFAYISTALVLGYGRRGISEQRAGRPTSYLPYVRYKRLAEDAVLDAWRRHGLPAVIIRPGDVFGPLDRTSSLPLLRALEQGLPLLVAGGRALTSYCYIDTLVDAVLLACARPDAVGRSFVVTNSSPVSWRRFLSGLSAGIGRRARPGLPAGAAFGLVLLAEALRRFVPLRRPPFTYYRFRRAIDDTTYDPAATADGLGLAPDERIDRQLGSIVDWYRDCRRGVAP